jgi:hypothetical protein
MGIAARAEEHAHMKASTPNNCEFACHTATLELDIVRGLGIELRIDVAKKGIERILELAEQQRASAAQFAFSIYSVSNRLLDVLPLTSDVTSVRAALANVDIGYGFPGSDANTFFDVALPQAASSLDGLDDSRATEVVVLTTDGVQSQRYHTDNAVRPIDLEYCDMLKANGRKLAVIYTDYHAILDDHTYDHTVKLFHDQLEPTLRACASSPELFIKGKTPEEIIAAFGTIFTNIVTKKLYLSS